MESLAAGSKEHTAKEKDLKAAEAEVTALTKRRSA